MPTYNADCILVQPEAVPDPNDELTLDHREHPSDPMRCRLEQMSQTKEALVLGQIAKTAYNLRLQTTLPVAAGWQARVRLDGMTDWIECMVRRASRKHHVLLLVEAI